MRPDRLNPLFAEAGSLKGVGPQLAKPLEKLVPHTVAEFLVDGRQMVQIKQDQRNGIPMAGCVLEFFGGIFIILGLFTRPVAFVLSGMMAVAYWQFHFPNGHWPVQNEGMPAVLFCFIFLYIAAQGAGDWSLDALIRRQSNRPATGE